MVIEHDHFDAVIVGSGPNGFAAAITLAERGLKVLIIEAAQEEGGCVTSSELTFPGVIHDTYSSVFPLIYSPFFQKLPLHRFGMRLIHSPIVMAHPFDDGSCAILDSLDETIKRFNNKQDRKNYQKIFSSLTSHLDVLSSAVLSPLMSKTQIKHPRLMVNFGYYALRSARGLMDKYFSGRDARSLFIGIANYSITPLNSPFTAAIAMVLILYGHEYGWPIIAGGAKNFSLALRDYFQSKGGKIIKNLKVNSMRDIPSSKAVLFDVTPRQILQIIGHRLPFIYRKRMERFQYGLGGFKIDWTVNKPVPFVSSDCRKAATVHIGGSAEEIINNEESVWRNVPPEKPFVFLVQPGLFDKERAPEGKYPICGYCHVPLNCDFDMTQRIETQIERFAPGFIKSILRRHIMFPSDLETRNANNVGGNIMGGARYHRQFFTHPGIWLRSPYFVPMKGIYICSSSTPPGGGVHGMCGYHAAEAVLQYTFRDKEIKRRTRKENV